MDHRKQVTRLGIPFRPEHPYETHARLKASADIHWISRKGAPIGSSRELQDAMMTTSLSKENGQVWFSAEAGVVRDVRRHFVADCGFDRSRVIAAGYWKKGETDFKDPDS
ncbi:SIP domain-containing protein [Salmonella enterica subsp. enterica serovar Falkensee]